MQGKEEDMARIKIKDLSKELKISKEEMRKVMGGHIFPIPQVVVHFPIYSGSSDGGGCVADALPSDPSTSFGDESNVSSGTISSTPRSGTGIDKMNP